MVRFERELRGSIEDPDPLTRTRTIGLNALS